MNKNYAVLKIDKRSLVEDKLNLMLFNCYALLRVIISIIDYILKEI